MSGAVIGQSVFDRLGRPPLCIAHRGFRACFPENTLCAFAASLGRCDMIELDVRLSADRVAVVFHDRMLTRTSDAGRKAAELGTASLALEDWPLAALRRLDAGSWFVENDPFGTIASGRVDVVALLALMPQRIPTLRETLTWAMHQGMALNIELKDLGADRMNEVLVAEVVAAIDGAGAGNLVLISSFNHLMLRRCHRLAPKIATAALQEGAHPDDLLAYLLNLGVCAYHPEDSITSSSLIRTLRPAGVHVNVFTVNDPHRQRSLIEAGATGIITDFPAPFPVTTGIPQPRH